MTTDTESTESELIKAIEALPGDGTSNDMLPRFWVLNVIREHAESETGLSPRKLAEQREELLGALEDVMHTCGEPMWESHMKAFDAAIQKARTAIRKARGEPVLAI